MIESVIAGAIANLAVDAASAANDRRQQRQRYERLSEELAPLETEFAESLGESIEARAWDLHSDALRTIATNWEPVLEEIDAYEVAFEDEDAAVEWLVTAVLECDVVEVDLDETEREELEQLVADAYADAFEQFRERVATDDELAHRLQTDLNVERLDRLEEIQRTFERLAESSAYQLHDFPEDREAVIDAVGVDRSTEFVDRPEVPDRPDVGRHFVLGPSGSGKSRVIAERLARLPDDAVEHVLVPEEQLLDTSDARALARESFDGDLLLVWEDVHRVDGGREDGVVRNVLRRLDDALEDQEYRFHALLEAQTGRLEDVFGNLPADFENDKSLWSTFEPLWLDEWAADQRRVLIDRMAARYNVAIDDNARDTLVERTDGSASAPVYVETAFKTAEGQLTVADIDALADEVAAIWERQYEHLRDVSEAEWQVLTAMKYLYDIGVPQYSMLVYTVFTDHLGAKRETFRTALEALIDRQWLTVVGDDLIAQETWFRVHDTQLEPVRVSAADDAHDLAELVRDVVGSEAGPPYRIPPDKHANVLFHSGTSFFEWRRYELAAEQWEETIRVDPDLLEAHLNCAVAKIRLDRPAEAEDHLIDALELDPDDAGVHANYAVILDKELNQPEEAINHFETALRLDSEHANAHANYAELLKRLGRTDEAEAHFEQAIRIDPNNPVAHFNYAMLLGDAGQPEAAAEHFEAALRVGYADHPTVENPETAKARTHANYAFLLNNDLNRVDVAEEHFERAIELNPKHVSARINYASLLEETGRPEQATEQYQEAIHIDPDHLESRHNYAMFLKRAGQPEKAAEHFEEALRIDSESATSHHMYADLLYQQLGYPEAAKEHYEKALELDSENATGHNAYATLLHKTLDQPEAAAEHYEKALRHASDMPTIHHNYGTLLLRALEQPKKAKEHLEAALELGMEAASLHHNYALLANEGLIDPTEAESHYRQALEIDPEDGGVHADFARFLHHIVDRPTEARDHYETALKCNPNDAVARQNYALLLLDEEGDSQAARKHLDTAIRHWIDEGALTRALTGLKRLVTICRKIGDDDTIVRACDLAADLLEHVDSSDDTGLFFQTHRLLARPADANIIELYTTGLSNVINGDQIAIELFRAAWDRRTTHEADGSERDIAVAAGLLLAAHLKLFEVQNPSHTVSGILSEVDAKETTPPESVLYEQLSSGSASKDVDELRSIAKRHRDEENYVALLRARAVAKCLDALQ